MPELVCGELATHGRIPDAQDDATLIYRKVRNLPSVIDASDNVQSFGRNPLQIGSVQHLVALQSG